MLANTLNNISVYWVAYGKKLAQVALANGGSDLVGTAFGEEIYRAAGKPTTSSICLLYTSPSPRDGLLARMPSSA